MYIVLTLRVEGARWVAAMMAEHGANYMYMHSAFRLAQRQK